MKQGEREGHCDGSGARARARHVKAPLARVGVERDCHGLGDGENELGSPDPSSICPSQPLSCQVVTQLVSYLGLQRDTAINLSTNLILFNVVKREWYIT